MISNSVQRHVLLCERMTLYSIYVMACAMPISISLTQIAIAVAILSTLVGWFLLPAPRPFFKIGLEKPLGAYIVAEFLSFLFSTNHVESFFLLKRLLLILVIYVVAFNLKTAQQRKQVLLILLTSFTVYSILGIYTYMTTASIRLHHIQNSMTAGGLTMLAVLVGAALLLGETTKQWRIGFLAATVLNLWALLLTSTRSAWLGCLVGLMIVFFIMDKKALLLLPFLMIGFYISTPSVIAYHVNHFFDPHWGTNAERLTMWKTGFQVWKDYPVFGIGDVSTQAVFKQYAPADFTYLIGHFHSNWVHLAVTLGAVGLAAFTFMMLTILNRLIHFVKSRQGYDSFSQAAAVAFLAAFVAFHISGLFEWNFGDAEIITAVWFLIGLMAGYERWSHL